MKTDYTTINPTTQAILGSKFNVFQLQKRCRRALRLSTTCRKLIDRHTFSGRTQYTPRVAGRVVESATRALNRCNAVLGQALQHCLYHNVRVDSEPVTPYRDARPLGVQAAFPANL